MQKLYEDDTREMYYDYMIENNLEDTFETIEDFLAAYYYDIMDYLDELCESFDVEKAEDVTETRKRVETKIRNILIGI